VRAALVRWYRRKRLHQELMRLNDAQLADIGLAADAIGDVVSKAYGEPAAETPPRSGRGVVVRLHVWRRVASP